MPYQPQQKAPKPPFSQTPQSPPGRENAMDPKPDYGLESYQGTGRFKDRVVCVTGGDSGIGRAVALAFAREGADCALSYYCEHDDAREIAKAIEDSGRRSILIPGDLAEESHCYDVIQQTIAGLGRLDVLINNAAVQGKSVEKFEDLSFERIENTFKVNVISMFHLIKYALPYLKDGSSIINVASVQAYKPSPGILDYAATKGAVVTLSKGLAKELIERGIRVNVVAPGPVWTPLIAQSFSKEKIAAFGSNYPIGRPAQPAELAPAFVFLASDDARFMTGEVLGVTGGELLP